jgi:hypothetical protein
MSSKSSVLALAVGLGLSVTACGGATRRASPQSAGTAAGTAALTGATLGGHFQRVLVAERGVVAMVARDGCLATITSGTNEEDSADEMRVRCPKPERIKSWFAGVDKITSTVAVEPLDDDDADDPPLPAAELVTSKGNVMLVKNQGDAVRLLSEVRALSAELASDEVPSPGPKSANGWQLMRVSGPAHVVMGGSATTGRLDARMSTNGQYWCEFVASKEGSPIRATKSGWVSPSVAAHAIDDVLSPLADPASAERGSSTVASGIAGGAEHRANVASTAAVFERFAALQDALGDACLPELDPPTNQVGL